MQAGVVGPHPVRSYLVWLLAPALLLVVSVLVLERLGQRNVREWATLVAVFNALFCAAPSIIIAFLAARDFLASGSPALLLLGPGALVFGLAYLVSGLLLTDANWGVTVHDLGLIVASLLFVGSGLSALRPWELAGEAANRAAGLLVAYLGTLALVTVIVLLVVAGVIPDFFIPGRGVTAARYVVLSLTVVLFLTAAVCFVSLYVRQPDRFLLLCGAAFAVVGVSLGAIVVTGVPGGSAISWIARAGQWLGGVYLLVAVFSLADRRILPLHRDLRELEERYRTLVELSPDPIIVDADGRYLFANPAAARLLGLSSPEELVGREIDDFVAPQDLELVGERRRVALLGHPASPQEIRLRRPDGTGVDVETMDRRVMLDGRPAALVIMRDITQRKQAEEALRRSEELYRSLAAENEQLYRQQLDIADSLQLALLNLPAEIGRLTLGHVYHSATEAARVGGDFYDVFEIKDPQIAVMIGDVAGHGIQAARTALLVKDVVHAFTHQSPRPRDVLRRTNKMLVEKEFPGFFVTLFLAVLNSDTGDLQYASAGHPATLLRRAAGAVEMLESAAPPLGIYPDASWSATDTRLDPGDLLLMYTDGVVEARRDGEFFGEERLKQLLAAEDTPVEELPEWVLTQVLSFSRGVLKDDVALLALSLSDETS
jgi:PAS domain S-box-containing protein